MQRIAMIVFAMASAIATVQAFAQMKPAKPPSWVTRLYGVPGPKVNFGSCQAPVAGIQLSPGALDFGTVAAPSISPSQRITITNVGNNVLSIISIDTDSFSESSLYQIMGNTCPPSLTPAQSCAVDISYDSTRDPFLVGPVPGTFTVHSNAPSAVAVASLSATAVAQAVPLGDVQPNNIDFGYLPVGTPSGQVPVTIQNVGNAPMTTVALTTTPDFAVASHNCAVVPVGGQCTANLTFTPSFIGGTGGFFTYEYNHPVFGTDSVGANLSGSGLSPTADIVVSPTFVDFGTITLGSGWSSGVDITNSGGTPLIINSLNIPAHYTISGTTCPIGLPGLAPAATCNVAFDADTSVTGFFSSTLTIDNTSLSNPLYDVTIQSFVIPDFTITPTFHDFGTVFVNPTPVPSVTVSLTNNGPNAEPISFSSQIFGANFTAGPGGASPCGATVGPGQTCTFVVGFQPTLPGGYFGPTIAIQNGSGTTWYDFPAIGTAIPGGPIPSFVPSFLDFGSPIAGSAAIIQNVDFTNVGNQAMNVASYATNAPFSAAPVVGFCPGGYPVVAPGESCRIAVTFTPPGAPGSFFESVQIIDSGLGDLGGISVFGQTTSGPTVAADFYPGALDFGNVGVNRTSAPQIVSFGNTGSLPLTILSPPTVTGPFLLSSACPNVLAPGDCCSLTATYTPGTPGGPDSGTITIPTDAGGMTNFTIPLAGVGVPPPSIDVVPFALPNTRVGTITGPTQLLVANVGVTTITITSIGFALPPEITPFDPAGGGGARGKARSPKASPLPPCFPGATVTVGSACGVDLWFAPTAAQTYSGTTTVTYSGGTASPAVIPVSARGVPPTSPDIALSSDLVDFPGVVVNTNGSSRLTITSTGTSPLQITAITALGTGFSQVNDCLRPLDPGASCAVDIGFRPDGLRAYTGDLVIEYEPAGSFRVVRLQGRGVEIPKPSIALSASSLAFNPLRVGTRSGEQALQVRNVGTAPLLISGIAATPGFVIEHGCNALAPGAQCTVFIRFAPFGAGQLSGTIVFTSNDPERPSATAQLNGAGCRIQSPSASRNLSGQCAP